MKGYLIVYRQSDRASITKINYYLFGRISSIQLNGRKEQYYYPGLFEQTAYKKLCNGCYFVKQVIDNYDDLLEIIPSTVEFSNEEMLSAKNYWRRFISERGLKVKNWSE